MTLTKRQQALTYSIDEAAALLGVSAAHAYSCIRREGHLGGVPVIRIGTRLVIARVALDPLLGIAPPGGGDANGGTEGEAQ